MGSKQTPHIIAVLNRTSTHIDHRIDSETSGSSPS
jgi:hypothetical protein